MRKFLIFLIAPIIFGLFSANEIYACACCAEKGAYNIRTTKPNDYEIGVLREIKFDKAVELFMTEAGFDGVKGLKTLEKDFNSIDYSTADDFFSLQNLFGGQTWKFDFKTKTGKSGALVLPLPAQMLSFKADIHDEKTSGGGGPLLYKEWRFKGNIRSGSGFFASGIVAPTTYFLVLQGRGNNCDNAQDFTDWRLEITGKNAAYAFFGKTNAN